MSGVLRGGDFNKQFSDKSYDKMYKDRDKLIKKSIVPIHINALKCIKKNNQRKKKISTIHKSTLKKKKKDRSLKANFTP